MTNNLSAHIKRKVDAADSIDQAILSEIIKQPGITAPEIMRITGYAEYALYRSVKRLSLSEQIRSKKTNAGKAGRQISVFTATGLTPASASHQRVLSKARTLPQPFASLVAQCLG